MTSPSDTLTTSPSSGDVASGQLAQNVSSIDERIAATVKADIRALAAYPVSAASEYIKLDAMECLYELPDTVRDAIEPLPSSGYGRADGGRKA